MRRNAIFSAFMQSESKGRSSSSKKNQRLENWKRRRAPAMPYFFRSTILESRVR
jgi:hypothetical protein